MNLCLVFLIPALSYLHPVGLCRCHNLSPSLSAALVVSIIHHLHSQAIYTSFYSQSAFTLCWLHLSTPIQIFRPMCAVLSLLVTSGSEKCIHWLPYINKRAPNKCSCISRQNTAVLNFYKMRSKVLSQLHLIRCMLIVNN